MSLILDENNAKFQIKAFKPGLIQVNDETLTTSLIITPHQLIHPWKPASVAQLKAEDLAIFITLHPSILLIGTGARLKLLPLELYGNLLNHGIGVEVMNTSAACRTFNALTSEERNVAAALFIN